MSELKLPKSIGKSSVDGWGVFHWPEFIALANRLGLPLEQRIKSLDLHIEVDRPVEADVKLYPVDIKEEYNARPR